MLDNLIGITEFRNQAKAVVDGLTDQPLVVLNHNRPAAVVLRPDAYEALVDRIDELESMLILAHQRLDGDTGPATPFEEFAVELGLSEHAAR